MTHTETLNAQSQAVVEALAERVSALEREMVGMNNALSAAFEKVSAGVGLFGERTTEFVRSS